MGCVSSKESINPPASRASWYSCLPCTSSTSTRRPPNVLFTDDPENRHVVSLTFSSYGALSMERPPCHGSFLSFYNKTKRYQAISTIVDDRRDDLVSLYGLDLKDVTGCTGSKPMREEKDEYPLLGHGSGREQGMETINAEELMQDLEEGGGAMPPRNVYKGKKVTVLSKPPSFKSSNADSEEETNGLKLLLSPAHPLSPLWKKAGLHATSRSLDGYAGHFQRKGSSPNGSRHVSKRRFSWQFGRSSSTGSDVPSFDPTLLEKFARVVMETSGGRHDEWALAGQGTEESTTNSSSSDSTWASAEMASDAESNPQWSNQDKHSSSPSIMPANEEENSYKGLLTSYPARCPPRGDGKVIFYHTSMRAIRKTYEDCCTVRIILKGLRIHVDERDVWMHSKYKEELAYTLGRMPPLPCLFIKGRFIGGAEEVKQLHEDGRLSRLIDGIPMDMRRSVCVGCADVRFVPCATCNGSCKVRNGNTGEVTQCVVCNENGLIMCPLCTN